MKHRILTGAEMKLCDAYTINDLGIPSRTLMESAAEAVVGAVIEEGLDIGSTLVVCGGGNNGGDGFATARFLAQRAREKGIEANIRTYFCASPASVTAECEYQREYAKRVGIPEDTELDLTSVTLVIDALFGIGLTRSVEGQYKNVIDSINASNSTVVSVDIPSGVNADTGAVMGTAVEADVTVTVAALKRGLLVGKGAEKCGKLIRVDIGIGTQALEGGAVVFTSEEEAPFPLPKRDRFSNKGTYGKVLIVAGAKNMAGAAYLSALAAYRTGAGLVRIFTAEENRVILQTLLPEAVLLTYDGDGDICSALKAAVSDSTSIVIGPGLSQSEVAKKQLLTVAENARCPLIIDADALNIIASDDDKMLLSRLKALAVLTPHMGEMSRLTGKGIGELKDNAIESALCFAAENGVVCCMKDARTVVSDGHTVYVNTSGNSGMSKGGSGDALTGIIAALISQGMTPFEATCTGVYLHGKAGDIAAARLGEYSLLARDIANNIGNAIKALKIES